MDIYSVYHQVKNVYAWISKNLPGGYALPPLNLVIETTYRCNLHCEMCYQYNQIVQGSASRGAKSDELTADEILTIINQTSPNCLIIFSGGEPFCRSDFMEILTRATRRRKCHLVTNGALIDPLQARQLVETGLLSVGLSIDGDRTIHDQIRGVPGTFERMIATAHAIREHRAALRKKSPVVNFKTVISKLNSDTLTRIYEIACEGGADYCTFQMQNNSMFLSGLRFSDDFLDYEKKPDPISGVDPVGLRSSLDELNHLSQSRKPIVRFIPSLQKGDIIRHYENVTELSRYTCDSPWTGVNVSPYGDIFPCLNYRIGNLKANSLMSLWNGQNYRRFRNRVKRGLFSGCIGCCDLLYRVGA